MRRRSRECALQLLYQLDVGHQLDPVATVGDNAPPAAVQAAPAAGWLDEAIKSFWTNFDSKDSRPVDRAFAERLVRGVVADIAMVDAAIDAASEHWKVGRMAKVDRNLIRIATYEIVSCPDIPMVASINEALEVAKRFSGTDSVSFINGVLDNIAKQAPARVGAER